MDRCTPPEPRYFYLEASDYILSCTEQRQRLLAARLFYTSPWMVVVLISVSQLGYGCCYSCSSALYADTAVYNEWKTGKNASGWIMGLTNLPLKVASTLKNAIPPFCCWSAPWFCWSASACPRASWSRCSRKSKPARPRKKSRHKASHSRIIVLY